MYVVELAQREKRRQNDRKRIRSARIAASGGVVLGIDVIRRCWVENCTFQRLQQDTYMCPVHIATHSCGKGSCKLDDNGKCAFTSHILDELEQQEFVAFVPETQYSSGRLDNRGEILSARFDAGMFKVISSLCDAINRKKAGMAAPPVCTVMEQLLIERDVHAVSQVLFRNCIHQKELKVLQTHGEELTFYILDKVLKGFKKGKKELFRVRYANWLLPLPTRLKFARFFGVSLNHYATCLKISQSLLHMQSVQKSLSKLNKV